MMPRFSRNGEQKLEDLDFEFAQVLRDVVREFDCTVVWTHRTEAEQNKANDDGFSKVRYPHSKHNRKPALAVDLVPYPEGYDATYEQFFEMATYVFAYASKRGLRIRWGGHWVGYSGKGNPKYDRDWAHFEKY